MRQRQEFCEFCLSGNLSISGPCIVCRDCGTSFSSGDCEDVPSDTDTAMDDILSIERDVSLANVSEDGRDYSGRYARRRVIGKW